MYIDHYKAIEKLIKDNLTNVKTVNWYNNQYVRTETQKTVNYPAVYIEFPRPVIWDTNGNGMQSADVNIRIHLVVTDIADSPEPMLNLAKELHLLLHKKILRNDTEQLSTSLVRRESDFVTEYDQFKVMVLGYNTKIYDCSAMQQMQQVQVGVVVTPGINQ